MGILKLTSSAFEDGGEIPREYGYKNGNISPPLKITSPTGTKSIALIMDDPDAMEAVGQVWVHWVMYNIGRHKFHSLWTEQIPRGNAIPKPLTKNQWYQAQGNSVMLDANREYLKEYNQKRFGDWESNVSGLVGLNDFGEFDYGGPAPPRGTHTYRFRAYALDIDYLPLPRYDEEEEVMRPGTKADVKNDIEDQIIEEATLTGTYYAD